MASLIDELIGTLELENGEYEELLELSKKKTPIIIEGNIEKLNEMVALEQGHIDRVTALEKKRTEVVTDIATVLNKDVNTLTVKHIINLLKGQDKEQKRLAVIHDKLRLTLNDMVVVNEINRQLIEESLELVDFNINYINGLSQIPELANYTKGACNSSSGIVYSRFDAKN